jgi:hypothetical protein
MNFVASLAAGLLNAAVLHVRSFTKGVSHESTTYSSNPGHRLCIFHSFARCTKRVSDAGLLQEARAVDDKPAVKNVRDCWRMHGHLMGRS